MDADKFEVLSCMRHCSQLLSSFHMTTESALLYLDYPWFTSMAVEVHHLIVAAKDFLANKYSDMNKFRNEVMNMPLAGIEAIFSSTDLHVKKWRCLVPSVAQLGPCAIPELEERRKILSSHLVPLVRFSHMTCEALQEIFTCTDDDIDHDQGLSLGYLCAKLIQHTNQARCSCSMCNLLFAICRASLQVHASESGSV